MQDLTTNLDIQQTHLNSQSTNLREIAPSQVNSNQMDGDESVN